MGFLDKLQKVQENLTCNRYWENASSVLQKHSRFEGIPENLLLNFSSWVALIVLFAILRKIAWDYGRIALVNRKEERKGGNHSRRWTELFYGNMDGKRARSGSVTSIDSLENHTEHREQGLGWFAAVFRLRDDHIARRCGLDAVQYLQFQQYLIVYMAVVTLLSLVVALPVNLSGQQDDFQTDYAHSTISNIDVDSPKLWIHTLLALIYLILAVVLMRRFSAKLDIENEDDAAKTLMVSYIPKDKCFKNTITQHFKEAYPNVIVTDVQFSFNIRILASLDDQRRRAHEGKTTSEELCTKNGTRPMMVPFYFGRLCCCCQSCGCRQVDAIDYYTAEERRLEQAVEQEKINAFQECTGIAFVIFETEAMAHQVYFDYNAAVCSKVKPAASSLTAEVSANNWDVEFAPDPNDINWQNLSLSPFLWWLRAIFINGALTLILFFLTTPSVIMNDRGRDPSNSSMRNAFQSQFLPSLILWFFSVMLPYVVYYSDQFIGHWTKTKEHQTVMRKTFTFLLLMVVILPALGLTSAKAFLEYAFSQRKDIKQLRWACIFMPGNGAFFVNYVITSAFIGNALTLIRFPELTMYVFRMLAARSAYEMSAVRRSVVWEFQFGQEYAWMLCNFTLAMVYSVLSPLVTPFGLVYLIGKHYVDKYNLYYAYKPSKINHHIHTSAINFVIIAIIILQFNMLFYNTLRTSWRHGLPIFSGIVVFFALLFLTGRLFFGWFKNWAPIKYRQFENKDEATAKMTDDQHLPIDEWNAFMPEVLQQARVDSNKQTTTNQVYGATDPDVPNGVVLDSTQFNDPEYIDTNLKRTESSPSVSITESESEDSGDDRSNYSHERITPLPGNYTEADGRITPVPAERPLRRQDSDEISSLR